jgi:hypothetical protein
MPEKHPSTERAFRAAAKRLMALRAEERRVLMALRAGHLLTQFDDFELRLLDERGYLCEHDRRLLSRGGRALHETIGPDRVEFGGVEVDPERVAAALEGRDG